MRNPVPKRPQLTLKSLFAVTTCIAVFFAGAKWAFQVPWAIVPFALATIFAAGIATVWMAANWRIPFLVVAAAIASVPFYGFFVHAGRDSQLIALTIILCWFLTVTFVFGSVILAVIRPPSSPTVTRSAVCLIVYLSIAGLVGFGGVYHAFKELLAG
jgi:hypothetical protein